MMKKTIFAVLLAAAMTASLAACTSSTGEKADEPVREEAGEETPAKAGLQ